MKRLYKVRAHPRGQLAIEAKPSTVHGSYDSPYQAIREACDLAENSPDQVVWVSDNLGNIVFDSEGLPRTGKEKVK